LVRLIVLSDCLDLFQPSQKPVRGCMCFFSSLSTFDLVQDFIVLVDSGAHLLLVSES